MKKFLLSIAVIAMITAMLCVSTSAEGFYYYYEYGFTTTSLKDDGEVEGTMATVYNSALDIDWATTYTLSPSDIITATISSANDEDTSEWIIAINPFDTEWGGWNAVCAESGETSFSTTVQDIMDSISCTDVSQLGGFLLQVWNTTENVTIDWELTIEYADDSGENEDEDEPMNPEGGEFSQATINGYKIIIWGDEAELTGYEGNKTVLDISSDIGGFEITGIQANAFYENTEITSVTIPDTVTYIGDNAFFGCKSLASVKLPASIKAIGKSAFHGCTSLTSIDIPEGVTSIGEKAFWCASLQGKLTIPSTVNDIGYGAFVWSAISEVEILGNPTTLNNSFMYCANLKTINIPDSVTTIGNLEFYGAVSLETVKIPQGVDVISESAFEFCSSLKSIEIPDGVTTIENYAFSLCESLETVIIPASVTSIGYDVFSDSDSLVIHCYRNSYAHKYAIDNGYEYKIIDKPLVAPVLSVKSGDKQATLNWTAVDGASYYQIIRYNKGAYSLIANISGTTATVKGLTNNFEYTYLIKAVADDGRTSFSNAVAVTPVAALAKPILSATAGDKQATLSWTKVDGASYYQIIRYNKGAYSLIANISGTSATVKGLTNNFEYTYLVKAIAADGRTSLSNAVNVTPVAALTKPTLSATAGNGQATLSWTKVEGASYYQIIRYNKGNYSLIANISGTSATVKGLTNNFEYTYLIKAVAEDGRTSFSNAVAVTPVAALAKPTLSATAGDKQVTLSWTKVDGASYYQIIRYNAGNYTLIANISGTSATVKGLTNNYAYTYLIKAVMSDGTVVYSNAVNVTPRA